MGLAKRAQTERRPAALKARITLQEHLLVTSRNGSPLDVFVKPLERSDVSRSALSEWRKGKVINGRDILRYVARRITLVMKSRGRILGLVNIQEPTSPSRPKLPEIVAVESNPKLRPSLHGVGSGLIAAAILVSKGWGYGGGVRLVADQGAVGFYQRLGMTRRAASDTENEFYFTAGRANQFLRAYEREARTHAHPRRRELSRSAVNPPVITAPLALPLTRLPQRSEAGARLGGPLRPRPSS